MKDTLSLFAEYGPVWILVGVLLLGMAYSFKFFMNKTLDVIEKNTEASFKLAKSIDEFANDFKGIETNLEKAIKAEGELIRASLKHINS